MINVQKMMQQAQEVQFRLQEMQEKFKEIEVTGEAGGGLVTVTMTLVGVITALNIDDSLMSSDKDMLEDLVMAAVNNAGEAKDAKIEEETKKIMGDMGLPEDAAGGLPF